MGKKAEATNAPLTNDLRNVLKSIVERELSTLPETLEALEPAQRVAVVCKLMGYVLPKVEAVRHNQGEPLTFDF